MGSFCKEEKREEKCGNPAISGDAESAQIRGFGLFYSATGSAGRRALLKRITAFSDQRRDHIAKSNLVK
jgi:hypothetical protein